MKVFFKLIKIYLASVFNFKNLKNQIQSRKKKKSGETITKNSSLKIIGIVFLFIIILAEFLIFFGFLVNSLYTTAKAVNNLRYLFELSTAIISLMSLLFGFMITASTYYIGEIEEQFLSMPIKPKTLFAAKFTTTCINSILASIAFFCVLMVIYGIYEAPPVIFYVWSFLTAAVIPLPVIAFCYIINILIMRFTRFFKNKNVIMIINAVIGMCLALGFNYLVQSGTSDNADIIMQKIAEGVSVFESYGIYYPPIKFAGKALINPASGSGCLNMLFLIISAGLLPVLVIFFMSKMYAESLVGFSEKKVKKLENKEISNFIKNNIKASPTLFSFIKREFNVMNRTPIYLLNGPFMIIFMPVLLLVIFIAKGNNLEKMQYALAPYMSENYIFVILGMAAGLLGSMTNIADTALSRDAKFIPVIKSLPANIQMYMYAKLIHAMIFAVAALIPSIIVPAFLLKLEFITIVFASLTALALSALLNLIALFIDTAHPKLYWDNPIAAMKQNMNVVLITLLNFILVGALAIIFIFAKNSPIWLLMIYFIFIPGSTFAVLIKPYGIYAERKIDKLEI